MSVLATGEAAVSLPAMAGDSAEPDRALKHERIRERLIASLTRVMVWSVPAIIVMCLLGEQIVAVILRTGRFDRDSTLRVAALLRVYGFALLGNASVRLWATAFFALGDSRSPARTAVVRVVASTLLSLALMKPLGVVGVVIGAVAAAWIEAVLLGRALGRELGGLQLRRLPLARVAGMALCCGGPAIILKHWLGAQASEPLLSAALLAVAGATFVVAASALKLLDERSLRWRV
jgi:putative peptidoglycan lipid II flippase